MIERPLNRQGRPRKWGDHCKECHRQVQKQWMRHGLCAACYQRHRRAGTIASTYVNPRQAQIHLAKVYAAGVSYRWIAKQAGTSTVNLNNVAQGYRARISRELADKILSVPVPAADENALRQRALQTAGMQGIYVGVERRYRQDRAKRRVPYHKRDRLRHSKKARFLSEREEFLAWLYDGMPTEAALPVVPIVRTVNWDTITCGDCETRPCACEATPLDADLSIRGLADNDDLCARELVAA